MLLTTATRSAAGGRQANQDFVDYAAADGFACWVVADGLGGHAGGEEASKAAVDAVLGAFRAAPQAALDDLASYMDTAQEAVLRRQGETGEDSMRTTLTILVAGQGHARWAHVGDSRLYHFRDGRVAAQTQDHSVPQALVAAGQITTEEIRSHPDRNRLLKALGKEGDAEPTVSERVRLQEGDAFLLCSDGFWELVPEAEMEAHLAATGDAESWLAAMEPDLLGRATGHYDNYTALAVRA